jgi:LacI family transcriptional regulator
MAQPTMRDVADAARVSLKTVSRVVNGEPGVRDETADRVRTAIAELGFRRNEMARALRRQRSGTLGLVIEDVSNPFYSAITRAVEEEARRRGLLVIAGSSDEDPERERELVRVLCDRRVDGLLVVPAGQDHRYLVPDLAAGLPAVFIDRPAGDIEADVILIDNIGGARAAVGHLARGGHRRIAMVGDTETIFTAAERRLGYELALKEHGLAFDPTLVRLGPHDVAASEQVVRDLLALADPPTAIFCGNNRNTLGALRALPTDGPRPGLVGFDDFELAELLPTPVTVVAYDPGELGRMAAELVCSRLDGDDRPLQRIALPTTLIARGSGEVRP